MRRIIVCGPPHSGKSVFPVESDEAFAARFILPGLCRSRWGVALVKFWRPGPRVHSSPKGIIQHGFYGVYAPCNPCKPARSRSY